jgi:transcriptional regulator with XRE-family HTH domain
MNRPEHAEQHQRGKKERCYEKEIVHKWPLDCFQLGNMGRMYITRRHSCQRIEYMSASINLLDKYKKACSIASDNACAASLGVGRAAVSKWRNGNGHPEADIIERMCEATGEPLARWLPLIEAERARSPGARRAWLRLAQVAATLAGIYIVSKHSLHVHEAALFGMAQVDIMRTRGIFVAVARFWLGWPDLAQRLA